MDEENLDELMDLDDAAPLLGLKNGTSVRSYIYRGVLEARKIGHNLLVTRRQINAYLAMKKGSGKQYHPRKPRTPPIGYIDPQKVILPR